MRSSKPIQLLTFVVPLIILATGCGFVPAPQQPAPWMTFTSAEGNFKTQFPASPTHSLSSDSLEHRFTAQYANGARLLRVGYEHNSNQNDTLADRIERLSALSTTGKVTSVAISRDGHPGMEATYDMLSGEHTFIVRHRIYVSETTSYQVISVMLKGENAAADTRKFFAAFRILPQ